MLLLYTKIAIFSALLSYLKIAIFEPYSSAFLHPAALLRILYIFSRLRGQCFCARNESAPDLAKVPRLPRCLHAPPCAPVPMAFAMRPCQRCGNAAPATKSILGLAKVLRVPRNTWPRERGCGACRTSAAISCAPPRFCAFSIFSRAQTLSFCYPSTSFRTTEVPSKLPLILTVAQRHGVPQATTLRAPRDHTTQYHAATLRKMKRLTGYIRVHMSRVYLLLACPSSPTYPCQAKKSYPVHRSQRRDGLAALSRAAFAHVPGFAQSVTAPKVAWRP